MAALRVCSDQYGFTCGNITYLNMGNRKFIEVLVGWLIEGQNIVLSCKHVNHEGGL